ncbi:MAG: hypothetical protein EOP56_10150 [Sphingobacteriales bacterium]|nr:MAG: hypothetical protein EOP56_10150 [Sphingobacteriales bacterium]
MDFILCALLSYNNGQLARRKGQNVVVWVLITIVAFFLAYVIGAMVLVALFYDGPFTQDALQQFMTANPLRLLTYVFTGIGGYMLIRYLLERMPDMPRKNDMD